MKKIKDEMPLEGKIETISMMDFRSSPGEVIDSVDYGKTFLIKKGKRIIAVLSKVPGTELTISVDRDRNISYVL